jgi:hypothetical protein
LLTNETQHLLRFALYTFGIAAEVDNLEADLGALNGDRVGVGHTRIRSTAQHLRIAGKWEVVFHLSFAIILSAPKHSRCDTFIAVV